jgi:hypothetical protein
MRRLPSNFVRETVRTASSLGIPVLIILLIPLCGISIAIAGVEKREVFWSTSTVSSALDAQTRRGRNVAYARMTVKPLTGVARQALDDSSGANRSGYEDDGGAVSGNFHFSVPVVALYGRANFFGRTFTGTSATAGNLSYF